MERFSLMPRFQNAARCYQDAREETQPCFKLSVVQHWILHTIIQTSQATCPLVQCDTDVSNQLLCLHLRAAPRGWICVWYCKPGQKSTTIKDIGPGWEPRTFFFSLNWHVFKLPSKYFCYNHRTGLLSALAGKVPLCSGQHPMQTCNLSQVLSH